MVLGKIVFHLAVSKKIGIAGGAGGTERRQPIRLDPGVKKIAAGDAAPTGHILHGDNGIAGEVFLKERRIQPRPDVATAADRKGDDPFDCLA